LRYLLQDKGEFERQWLDALEAGKGGIPPAGLIELDPDEFDAPHPSQDPALSGLPSRREAAAQQTHGQCRQPFELGQLLKALGMELSDHDLAVHYYRERALPYLVRFPRRELPESQEPLMEGLEPWDYGHPLETLDLLETVLASPRVVPGMTTVQRVWGVMDGPTPRAEPVDLDLYVDCSGSMPNPRIQESFTALAGAILTLSALRAGSRVQATLWSGAGEFDTTGGFIRDEKVLLRILTGYLGGGTAFPIHLLRDTCATRRPSDRAVHILVLSDDGVDTMGQRDERGNDGFQVARDALRQARGGGTLVLNLYRAVEENPFLVRCREAGWNVHRVTGWEELVVFAREFSRLRYENRIRSGIPAGQPGKRHSKVVFASIDVLEWGHAADAPVPSERPGRRGASTS
ncbi:MAG: vWA domain-containing protein, partial [Candidatus Eremiobacterota bacterium]